MVRFLEILPDAPYDLRDMAEGTIALMDVLGIHSAHLVGASMGGMIAQEIAIGFPDRVRSLTSIMSTTGNPALPQPTNRVLSMLTAPQPKTREELPRAFDTTRKCFEEAASRKTKLSTAPEPSASTIAGLIERALLGKFEQTLHREAARSGCATLEHPPW